jgi:phosphonate transport system ATP-binding protein
MNDQRGGQPALRLIMGGVVYPNGARALHPTSLDFAEGAFTVLLGPSGAGKSTLLRSLNGLVPLTEGHVETARLGRLGTPRAWREHRRATGMVFQQHQLIGRLTAFANVLTGRLGHHSALRSLLPLPKAEKRLALEALERVGLIDFALRRADQLSGGQQQRVGIARALAQRPGLILADEPVASLDPATAVRVLALLHGICRQDRLAAIVSLHQVELARQFADRIIGIGAGRVVFDGPPEALDDEAVHRIYGGAAATPAAALTPETLSPKNPVLETTP